MDLDQNGHQNARMSGGSPAVVRTCIQTPNVVLVVAWADLASCFAVRLGIHRRHSFPRQAIICAS